MTEWKWVNPATAEAIHDEQLAEHGGGVGMRDRSALLSALARPQNIAAYDEPDVADLAASYAFGVAKNHPFIDGNKRTAWVLARLFLAKNGRSLRYENGDAVRIILDLASGAVTEAELAGWFRERITGG